MLSLMFLTLVVSHVPPYDPFPFSRMMRDVFNHALRSVASARLDPFTMEIYIYR